MFIGEVIVIIDKDGINRYKSPNIKALFGWEPEELVGQITWNTVHPDHLDYARKFLSEIVLKPNATGTTEIRYKRKNGEYVWIEITLVNLLSDPDINGFLGNYHDITKRKHANLHSERFTSKSIVKAIIENPEESRKGFFLEQFRQAGIHSSNVNKYQFWRHDNHPIELWSNKVIDEKIDYIHNNPVKAGLVSRAEDYLYSSAADYAGGKGMLDGVIVLR